MSRGDPTLRSLGLVMRPGCRADLSALAGFHYAPSPPAVIDRVITVASRAGGAPVAVLAAALPTLNDSWRAGAFWRTGTGGASPRARAARLGREVRTIARLIVDPRYRGLGLGRRLVRAYLRSARVRHVEAVAAMGRWCPVFASAGMRARGASVSRRDRVLLAHLSRRGLAPHHLCERAVRRRLARDGRFIRVLRTWFDASGSLRRHRRLPPGPLIALASTRFHPFRTVYTWSRR